MDNYKEILEKQFNGENISLEEKLILLEHDVESYVGDYSSLESALEDTFNKILEILKLINNKLGDK